MSEYLPSTTVMNTKQTNICKISNTVRNVPSIDTPFFGILIKISQNNWENGLIKISHVENCATNHLPLPREFAKIT